MFIIILLHYYYLVSFDLSFVSAYSTSLIKLILWLVFPQTKGRVHSRQGPQGLALVSVGLGGA